MSLVYSKRYLSYSLVGHVAILALIITGFDMVAPLPVIENTNQHDVISAVVLGDTETSKILPEATPVLPKPPVVPQPKPILQKQVVHETLQRTDAIPLKAVPKKKVQKVKLVKQDFLAKDLLADMQKVAKQKKMTQKNASHSFEKTLRAQAEKTLRQNLFDDEIKLKGDRARFSQGEVNKYKALIVQSISEHWLVPPGADKRRYCELMIRIAPGGMVLDVQISKSSGDPALDSSARLAVMKASPLPVPNKNTDFEPFRQFVLKVRPENIVSTAI